MIVIDKEAWSNRLYKSGKICNYWILLWSQDLRVNQEKKPYIKINIGELDRELYTRLSTLDTKLS